MQYPLSEDPAQEDFTAVFNRSPLTVEILSSPSQLLSTFVPWPSLVFLLFTVVLPPSDQASYRSGQARVVCRQVWWCCSAPACRPR